MAREGFWAGLGVGTLTGVAAGFAAFALASARGSEHDTRILRLERSIQIGRSAEEVFAAWSRFEDLPDKIASIGSVHVNGAHSSWTVMVNGRPFGFTAEIAQVIPNQAIGWKSISGPKHSGRIHFMQLGEDTLVHVIMNYAPPLGRLGILLSPVTDHLEGRIEEALRDFKRALEATSNSTSARGGDAGQSARDLAVERWGGRAPASAGWDEPNSRLATGTDGIRKMNPAGTPGTHLEDRSGAVLRPGAVDYTRPPKAK